MIDPIHQFNIDKIFTIGHIGNQEIAFTNSSAYMFISVALISLLMIGGVARRQLVPGRFQSMAELSYEFVANTIRSSAGSEGMKFFPLVFSLFMFIMVSNMIGIIPYTFTVSSHIIVTASLALLVFFTVLVYGFYKNGLKFFAQRASVRQHAGRPHHAESVRKLRHHVGGDGLCRRGRRHIATGTDGCVDRA
jgi:F-type H+-transporting ATPase subunit a